MSARVCRDTRADINAFSKEELLKKNHKWLGSQRTGATPAKSRTSTNNALFTGLTSASTYPSGLNSFVTMPWAIRHRVPITANLARKLKMALCRQLSPSGVFVGNFSFSFSFVCYILRAEAALKAKFAPRVAPSWAEVMSTSRLALRKGCIPSLGLRQLLLQIFLAPAAVMTPATTWDHQILVPIRQIFE